MSDPGLLRFLRDALLEAHRALSAEYRTALGPALAAEHPTIKEIDDAVDRVTKALAQAESGAK